MAKTTVPDAISLLLLISNSITVTILPQIMEEKRPQLPRRPPSFNPEAATFSPTKGNAMLWPSAGKHGPTPPASPRKTAVTPATAKDESPFRTAGELRPIYEAVDEANGSRAQPDPGYMPLDLHDLIRALEQAQREAEKHFPTMQSIDTPMPYLPPGLFSPQRHEANFSAPAVDELSKTLGLPGVTSKEKAGEEVPLMEQALDKPLTANTLAHYMSSPDRATKTAHPSRPSRAFGVQRQKVNKEFLDAWKATAAVDLTPSHHLDIPLEQINGEDPATKIVQPPPGFYGENPRMIQAEEPQTASSSVTLDPQPIPTAPSNFGRARRFSDLQSPNSLQLHHPQYRVPGSRRHTRPRASTRSKRSDQGPEPSAADIYPDDAVYMPPNGPSSTRRPSFALPDPHITTLQEYTLAPLPHLCTQRAIIEDPTLWPTPAEVYAGKAPPSTIQQQQPLSSPVQPPAAPAPSTVFDPFADHCPPSSADMHEADGQVDALINFAPYLFALDLSDAIMRDERPLTPGQEDGSRYGLRFHGIGLGDSWKGAAPAGGDRVGF